LNVWPFIEVEKASTSGDFAALAAKLGSVTLSLGRKGQCWDCDDHGGPLRLA
jgi:hypothetical protein